jgi:glycosyltransferase involved in cell wall biosynthesis
MQKVDFDFEIIIADDFSTDNTREILISYKNKYPEKINLLLAEKNQGVFINAKNINENCQGKYIAILEGDDYWLDENKLQKQVDFLEKNFEYAGCFHDASIISTNHLPENTNEQAKEQSHGQWKTYSQFNRYTENFYPWDVLQRKIIPTASLVFRKKDLHHFYEKFSGIELSLSWAYHLEIIRGSKFKYFNEIWSMYVDHPHGFSKSIDMLTYKLNNIRILLILLDDEYYFSLKKDVYKAIAQEYFFLLHCNQAKELKRSTYQRYLKEYIRWSKKMLKAEADAFKEAFEGK